MENKKIKFNIVDIIVIVALVAVIAFAAYKILGIGDFKAESDTEDIKYKITFYTEESTWYSLEGIKKGDPVSDDGNGVELGEVTELDLIPESCAQIPTAEGTYKVAHRPGYGSGSISFECEGSEYEHGAKIEYGVYGIGQTVTLRVGDSKVYGRVKDIQIVEN